MGLILEAEPLPLAAGSDGVIRVSGTRVTLDTFIGAYLRGRTPEEIAQSFDTVPLGDVHLLIGYCLRHRSDVDEYLEERARRSGALRSSLVARLVPAEVKARLSARRDAASE